MSDSVQSEKRVLVVGSSRGIGKEIAINLARQGFVVTVHGRSESDALDAVYEEVRSIANDCRKLVFDVCERQLVEEILEKEVGELGAYYGVVLSMGITADMPFPGMDGESWDKVINVDLNGFYNVLRPLVLPMIRLRDGGRIVSIASLSGVIGNRGQVNYSAAKAGLIGASKALSRELAKRKITVNCVAPGGIETDMIDEKIKTEMLKTIPMGRLGKPEEIAGAVSFLFSDSAAYMTGQSLVISGGLF